MALRELDGYDAGRRAFLALIASLPRATAGDPFGRERRARPAAVREALAGWVPRAAFVLAASARGLLAGDAAELCARLFPSQSELAGLGPVRAALDELRRSVPESSFGSFEPELLGSVYEGTIGTGIAVAGEATAILRPRRRAGDATCEVALDLHELCAVRGGQRAERLAALGVELEAAALRKLARAGDAAELGTLLVESRRARARLPVAGTVTALLTVDRRRSGSHYTPRLLAERVVCATLEPLLGPDPTPDSILALRICDPAMGTGAFLLAACRFLAEKLQAAAARVGTPLPASEAHRTVAERCLYGVDRDRAAIDVAKLALWLVTGDGSLSLDRFAPVLVRGEALLGAPPIESRAARE
ncbi:MAG TPA: N-6 DNA methylase, partial [Polyangiaceae bacterium]